MTSGMRSGGELADVGEGVEAVAIGEPDVEQDDVVGGVADELEGLRGGGGGGDEVALLGEDGGERGQDIGFVVDDEDVVQWLVSSQGLMCPFFISQSASVNSRLSQPDSDELTADEAVSLCVGAAAGHVVGRDEVWDLASAIDDEVPRGAGTAEGEGFEVGLVVIEEDESRAISSLSTDLFVLGQDGSRTESTEVHVEGGEALAGGAVEGLRDCRPHLGGPASSGPFGTGERVFRDYEGRKRVRGSLRR